MTEHYPLKEYFNKFALFSESEWNDISSALTKRHLKKGCFFVKEGEVCNEIAFIIKGCFRYFHFKDGKQVTISFFIEDEFLSALPSFLARQKSNQVIDALEDSELLVINYEGLQKVYLKVPSFEKIYRGIIEKLLIGAQNRLADYLLMPPEERYIKFLKESPHLLSRIPQHYIASYLGITSVSLSRIRKRIISK